MAHMGEMHAGFWLENLKVSDYLGDIGLDGRIVLRSSQDAGYDHDMFFAGLAAAEGSAVTAAVTTVSVHTTAAATAKNGHIISRVNSSHNAAADIVLIAGVCSRRTAASATDPYSIFSQW